MSCYICETDDGCQVYRVCRCNSVVHEKCFKRLVEMETYTSQCAICKWPFDTEKRDVFRVKYNFNFCSCVLPIIVLSGGIAACIYVSVAFLLNNTSVLQQFLIMSLGFAFLSLVGCILNVHIEGTHETEIHMKEIELVQKV